MKSRVSLVVFSVVELRLNIIFYFYHIPYSYLINDLIHKQDKTANNYRNKVIKKKIS